MLDADGLTPGDPDGMRALAATLSRQAEEIAAQAEDLLRRIHSLAFEGPSAERLRAGVGRDVAEARRVAAELLELAGYISRAAGRLESESRVAGTGT